MRAIAIAKPGRRTLLVAVAALAAAALAAGLLSPTTSGASSHREAPLTAADPQIDNTDVYAFVSPDDDNTVTLISNWIPFEEPSGGPNFFAFAPGVRYDINVSNDGDANPELIYRWQFKDHYRNPDTFLYNTGPVTSLNDANLNFYQTYSLKRIKVGGGTKTLVEKAKVAPNHVGDPSMPDFGALRDDAIVPAGAAGQTYAGPTNDPFFLDLRVFDLLYGGDLSEVGDDTLKGFNTHTMVLQVPKNQLAKNNNSEQHPTIGVWSTASRRSMRIQKADGTQTYKGSWVQVSRLGMPLVNEVVVPVGLKDYFNGSKPKNDEQFLGAVNDPELARLIEAIYAIPAPDTNDEMNGIQRDDLIAVFLTGLQGLNKPNDVEPAEMLRLNMSIPPCVEGDCGDYSELGVIGGDNAGFPNGRRLGDDVIDIAVQVVEGELVDNPNDLGDGVSADDKTPSNAFPYVTLPNSGSETSPH